MNESPSSSSSSTSIKKRYRTQNKKKCMYMVEAGSLVRARVLWPNTTKMQPALQYLLTVHTPVRVGRRVQCGFIIYICTCSKYINCIFYINIYIYAYPSFLVQCAARVYAQDKGGNGRAMSFFFLFYSMTRRRRMLARSFEQYIYVYNSQLNYRIFAHKY